MLRRFVCLVAACSAVAAMAGCSGKAPELSKEEKENFKGGPMPESARQIMQQKLEEAKRSGAQPGQPGGQPSGGASDARS